MAKSANDNMMTRPQPGEVFCAFPVSR